MLIRFCLIIFFLLPFNIYAVIDDESTNSILLQRLESGNKIEIIRALNAYGDRPNDVEFSMPYIIRYMQDSDPYVRTAAQKSLEKIGDLGIKYLIDLFEKNKEDKAFRSFFVLTLSRLGDGASKAIPTILEFLESEDENEQIYAILAMTRIGMPNAKKAIEPIAGMAKSNNPLVRDYAFFFLQKIGGDAKNAVPILIEIHKELQDTEISLDITEEEKEEQLAELKKHKNQILDTFRAIGTKDALKALQDITNPSKKEKD